MNEKSFSKRLKNEFRKSGWTVIDMEGIGNGVPDCCIIKYNTYALLEFKYGKKEAEEQLTKHQVSWFKKNGMNTRVFIVSEYKRKKYKIIKINRRFPIFCSSLNEIINAFAEGIHINDQVYSLWETVFE